MAIFVSFFLFFSLLLSLNAILEKPNLITTLEEVTGGHKLDLVVLLDESNPSQESEFQLNQHLLDKLNVIFENREMCTAIVSFATTTELTKPFSCEPLKLPPQRSQMHGSSSTHLAFQVAHEVLSLKARQNSQKFVFLLTKGNMEDQDLVEKAVDTLKKDINGVAIFSIGIGDFVNEKYLQVFSNYYYHVNNWKQFEEDFGVMSSDSQIQVNFLLDEFPASIEKPIHLIMHIFNYNTVHVPQGTKITFKESSLTESTQVELPESIPSRKSLSIPIILQVKERRSFKDLPKYIFFEINGFSVKHNALQFRSDWICKTIVDYQPVLHNSYIKSWMEELPQAFRSLFSIEKQYLNVAFFGMQGAGKSTTINLLLTALSNSDVYLNILASGGLEDHVTTEIEDIVLDFGSQNNPLKIKFFDTIGLTQKNWPNDSLQLFLRGQLKKMHCDDQYETILLNIEADQISIQHQMHVVLLFAQIATIKDQEKFKLIKEAYKIVLHQGYNPLLILTLFKGDENGKREIAQLYSDALGIRKNQIFFVPFYDDNRRTFEIDKEALVIIDEIIQAGEKFLRKKREKADESFEALLVFAIVSCCLVMVILFCWCCIESQVTQLQ